MTDRPASRSAAARPIKVMLVDDQVLLRRGLRMMLDAEVDLEVVGEAGDGKDVSRLAAQLNPDVVVMDIRMPEVDGVEATRSLLAQSGDGTPRVLILTTFDLDEYVLEALRVGASGFLLKEATPEEIVNGIRVVASGDALLAPSVTRRLIGRFVTAAPVELPAATPSPPPGFDRLTPRELEVFDLLARGRSNAEIGREIFLSEPTVKTHVGRVLMKLGVRDRVQAVVLAYETGLVHRQDP